MNILLLGKSGFIGKNIHKYFMTKYDVDCPSRQDLDVLDEKAVFQKLNKGKYDIVINALDVRDAKDNYFEKRIRMFTNLANHNDLYGKMLYFGSGAEYGKQREIINAREEDFGKVIPTDMYGLCMYTMQKLASQFPNVYNFRLFGIFGKYEIWQSRFISNAICKALHGYPITIRQNTKFDYLYIDDLCKMVAYFIENEMKHQNYNATSGKIWELYDLAQLVNQCVEKSVPIFVAKDGWGRSYTSNNEKIKIESNLSVMSMKDSIQNLVKWYEENREQIHLYELLYQK